MTIFLLSRTFDNSFVINNVPNHIYAFLHNQSYSNNKLIISHLLPNTKPRKNRIQQVFTLYLTRDLSQMVERLSDIQS